MGAVFKSDWLPTKVNDAILEDYVKTGNLDPQDVIGWRTGLGEEIPNPKEGEIVVFVQHLEWIKIPQRCHDLYECPPPRSRAQLDKQSMPVPSVL